MFNGKTQLTRIWTVKPDSVEKMKENAESHTNWMKETHNKEGEKALLMLNWCMESEKDEEGNCPVGPKKIPKLVPEEELFATTYYEFPGNFTTNLKGSKKFLQVSLGVSTQYDEQVMANVDSHQLALRSEILGIISEFTAEDVSNREGKKQLAEKIRIYLPKTLIHYSNIGEDVDKRDYIVSNAKLEEIGWKPNFSLDDGITELIKCYNFLNLDKTKNI